MLYFSFAFSRERPRRAFRKKAFVELRLIYIFTSSHLHIYICTSTSLLIFTPAHLHLHIYISAHLHICTSKSLLIFTSAHLTFAYPVALLSFSLKAGGGAAGAPRNATLCGDRACRGREMQVSGREMQVRLRFGLVPRNPLRRSCVSRARNAGEIAFWPARATLCGDRACRGRGVQVRLRFGPVRRNPMRRSCASRAQVRLRIGPVRRNPLRRSCVLSARNAGEIAFWIDRASRLEEVSCERPLVSGMIGGPCACTARNASRLALLSHSVALPLHLRIYVYTPSPLYIYIFTCSHPQIYLSTSTHPHICTSISHLHVHIVAPSPPPLLFLHIFSLNIKMSWLLDNSIVTSPVIVGL